MFITLEGIEGCGKTVQARLLADHLCEQGLPVLLTREPGGTEIGDQIRQVLHDTANTAMLPSAEILLYSAARAQIVGQVIRPALAAGQIVVSDRYADSTLAYQGYGRCLDLADLRYITQFATGGLRPDVTFLIDLDVAVGLGRKHAAFRAQRDELNRMDRQSLEFYERVRSGYLAMSRAEPDRWLMVDGDRGIETIQADIRRLLAARMGGPARS